jgi:uncharacterized metal-binding protein YceD (DUF177 family)
MMPELQRPVRVARIGSDGFDVLVEPTEPERVALAARMQIPAVEAMTCRFHVRREGYLVVVAEGWLQARVMQTCIVSAEDFETTVEERFRIRFVPAGEESDDPDPDSDDELPYEGDSVDVGEAAAEQLALALDPYPRMPDAVLPEIETEDDTNPFAALAALRKQP